MSQATDIPVWAAIIAATLLVVGAGITLIGSLGLLRLATFYERVHAPTLGTTLGAACIASASIITFTALQSRRAASPGREGRRPATLTTGLVERPAHQLQRISGHSRRRCLTATSAPLIGHGCR
jgi:hypothetical protein